LGWITFGGSHILLSHGSNRSALTGKLGPLGFSGVYSRIARAAFTVLVMAYFPARHAGAPFWDLRLSIPAVRVTEALAYVAFFLISAGLLAPSPLSLGSRDPYEPRGLTRITRHPFLAGTALLGLAHCIPNGFPSDLAFFGGLSLFSLAGAFHQDARKRREAAPEAQAFFEHTSVIPFAAILAGAQTLKPGELPWLRGGVGVVAAYLIRNYHDNWWGMPLI
ncbi:MAG: NnrU family protein, partial [Deltaproteobacteria bacterium]|nr:NnrU family protein [Deltaproteobacteria bacterium]